tara:strand:- start:1445 stop:1819 length:375 start_codon:yes stop_codon:yes gene_type:complete
MTSNKNIINQLDRKQFINLINLNNGLIIIKFGAEWCGPCKKITPFIEDQFYKTPESVTCVNIDIDENIDLFAYMKKNKMIKGVPAVLAYKKENKTFVPDMIVNSSDENLLISFFQECVEYINTI